MNQVTIECMHRWLQGHRHPALCRIRSDIKPWGNGVMDKLYLTNIEELIFRQEGHHRYTRECPTPVAPVRPIV